MPCVTTQQTFIPCVLRCWTARVSGLGLLLSCETFKDVFLGNESSQGTASPPPALFCCCDQINSGVKWEPAPVFIPVSALCSAGSVIHALGSAAAQNRSRNRLSCLSAVCSFLLGLSSALAKYLRAGIWKPCESIAYLLTLSAWPKPSFIMCHL